jgi:hypothetical protein
MKSLFLFIATSLSIAAFADTPCDKFIGCGTYDGAGYSISDQKKSHESYFEEIVVTPVDDTAVKYEDYLYGKGQKPGDKGTYQIHLILTFKNDGSFTAIKEGKIDIIVNGKCLNLVCDVDILPWKNPESTTGNVNILRFEKNILERNMMASAKLGEFLMEHTRLTKK